MGRGEGKGEKYRCFTNSRMMYMTVVLCLRIRFRKLETPFSRSSILGCSLCLNSASVSLCKGDVSTIQCQMFHANLYITVACVHGCCALSDVVGTDVNLCI